MSNCKTGCADGPAMISSQGGSRHLPGTTRPRPSPAILPDSPMTFSRRPRPYTFCLWAPDVRTGGAKEKSVGHKSSPRQNPHAASLQVFLTSPIVDSTSSRLSLVNSLTWLKKQRATARLVSSATHLTWPFADLGFQLARELRKECVQTQQVNEVLFKDKQLLGGYTAVFDQLSPVGQMVLSAAAENSMGALLGALSGSSPDELGSTLGAALATVQQANDTVKGHIRHFLLESSAFNRLDVLANISQLQGGAAADLGLVADARLRAENIMNRVSPSPRPTR